MSRVSRVCRHMAALAFQMVCVPCLETHSWSGVTTGMRPVFWRHKAGLASQLVYVPSFGTHSLSGVSTGTCPLFGDTNLFYRLNSYVSRVWRQKYGLASQMVYVPCSETHS